MKDRSTDSGEFGDAGIEGSDLCDGGPVSIDLGDGGSGRSGDVGRQSASLGGVGDCGPGLYAKPG